MKKIFEIIFFTLFITNMQAGKTHKNEDCVEKLKNFYVSDYSTENMQDMLKFFRKLGNNKNKEIEKILNEFMAFVECVEIRNDVVSKYFCKIKNADDFKNLIKAQILKILSTDSGKILICSLLHLMNRKGKKIIFEVVSDGYGISTYEGVIYIDLSHFFSSTGFYVCDGSWRIVAETATYPDVYLFHELLHYKHYLENSRMSEELGKGILSSDMNKFNENLRDLGEDFPRSIRRLEAKESKIADDVDYEEMRTIIGVPFEKDSMIICENSYRYERKYCIRYNLLDAELGTVNTRNRKKIMKLIKKAIGVY